MNPLADKINELEKEILKYEDEPSYEKEYGEVVVGDIKLFCSDCPIKDDYIKCGQCTLSKYKNIE